jgi:hypothetical protein
MPAERPGVLIADGSPFRCMPRHRDIDRAVKHRPPAIDGRRNDMDAGGLMSYGISIADLWRRAAADVDTIRKGVKAADLLVAQPMTCECVVNLKTAQALGVTIPPTLLFEADEVVRWATTLGAPTTRVVWQLKPSTSVGSIRGYPTLGSNSSRRSHDARGQHAIPTHDRHEASS